MADNVNDKEVKRTKDGSAPIFKQRRDTILLGLTGRTGSGCSYMASILGKTINELHSDFSEIDDAKITNEWRQKRVINDFIKKHWSSFITIKASDFIFYFLLLLSFDDFIDLVVGLSNDSKKGLDKKENELTDNFEPIKGDFESLHSKVEKCEAFFKNRTTDPDLPIEWFEKLDFSDLDNFRRSIKQKLPQKISSQIELNLQTLGNNIRKYGSVKPVHEVGYESFSGLAEKIDKFISEYIIRNETIPKRIVIDALRSPADILCFREKYAYFYLVSVSADESVRRSNLFKANITAEQMDKIDKGEDKPAGGIYDEYANIYISRCIEISDIHLVNYENQDSDHKKIVGQLLRYVALILHPGLVTPTKYERVMQVAVTAKLNSGCLSRQVGATVTNDKFSVMSIGWNEVPEKQVPCSLRYLDDLTTDNDPKSFSTFEHSPKFKTLIKPVHDAFKKSLTETNNGIHLTYCFKDIFTTGTERQKFNQVHTRSLHAEENAFLQLSKYGSGKSVIGGKLFTTASCCVLCAKKAYQLGISEIFFIDAYPDISQSHILESGDHDIKMILFQGAIGRAYMKLYDQFLPIKDELELHHNIKVKKIVPDPDNDKITSQKKGD